MNRLDWSGLNQEQVSFSDEKLDPQELAYRGYQKAIRLSLRGASLEALVAELKVIFETPKEQASFNPELKLELPQGWTLYFKSREGESRMVVAHPEDALWVANISLIPMHGAWLIRALSELRVGSEPLEVHGMRHVGFYNGVSNLNLWIGRSS